MKTDVNLLIRSTRRICPLLAVGWEDSARSRKKIRLQNLLNLARLRIEKK